MIILFVIILVTHCWIWTSVCDYSGCHMQLGARTPKKSYSVSMPVLRNYNPPKWPTYKLPEFTDPRGWSYIEPLIPIPHPYGTPYKSQFSMF